MAVHVEVEGAGEPAVVLTHGVGDTASTWDKVRAVLAAQRAVVVWDLPEHGRSAGFARVSRDVALAELASLCERSGPGVLVGHSMGGYLSLALAVVRPELVRGLVLVATGPGYRDAAAREQWNEWLQANFSPQHAALGAQPDALVIDRLGEVGCPVRLVVGEADRRYHAGMRYLERKLAAPLVVVPGARHHVQESHPEVVATLVDEVVSEVAA